jgi:hypothetical protein
MLDSERLLLEHLCAGRGDGRDVGGDAPDQRAGHEPAQRVVDDSCGTSHVYVTTMLKTVCLTA